MFHDTTTNENTGSLIVANQGTPSEQVLKMCTTYWQHMPETIAGLPFRPRFPSAYNNNPPKDRLEFPDINSRIVIASARSIDQHLGAGFHNIHATEVSRYKDGTDMFRALSPTLTDDPLSMLVQESTPNGKVGTGRYFYDQCMQAKENAEQGNWENEATRLLFITWMEMTKSFALPFENDDKRRAFAHSLGADELDLVRRFPQLELEQLLWRRATLQRNPFNTDPELFDQEYPCLVYGTLVGTNVGILQIGEVPAGAQTALGTVREWRMTGVHECVRVETSMGYTIEATLTHPIATTDGLFVMAGESLGREIELQAPRLADSEHVVRYHPLPVVEARVAISPLFARLLGYYMGDGSLYGATLEFACSAIDQDVVADVRALIEQFFGSTAIDTIGPKKGCTRIRHNSTTTRDVLLALGVARIEKHAKRVVCVPECIFRSPRPVVREFIRGLFEADGWISKTKNTVKFFTKDEKFSRDVQVLLLAFGIHCNRRRVFKKGAVISHPGYEITLWSLDAQKYMAEVGFTSARKNAAPVLKSGSGRTPRVVGMKDTVVAVTPIGEQPVYDIEVSGQHIFDANGILVHNTDLASAFLSSGSMVFGRKHIKRLLTRVCEPIWRGDVFWGDDDEEQRRNPHMACRKPHVLTRADAMAAGRKSHTNERTYNNLKVWKWPTKGDRLFVCGDVGGGDPDTRYGDYSVLAICRMDDTFDGRDEVIMTWRGHLNPVYFGELSSALSWWLLKKVGDSVRSPELVLEWNGPGVSANTTIDRQNLYPHTFRYIQPGVHGQPKTKHIGWESNAKTKPQMVNFTQRHIELDRIWIGDELMVEELSSYRQLDDYGDSSSYGGDAGTHDDSVTALEIGIVRMRQEAGTNELVPVIYTDENLEHDDQRDDVPWDSIAERAMELGSADDEDDEELNYWSG